MAIDSFKIFFFLIISCNVCHEYYPFYLLEAARVPPTNTTASQDTRKGGISSLTIVEIVIPISVAALILIPGICCLIKRTRNKHVSDPEGISAIGIINVDSLRYDLHTIQAATNNFSADNKLGKGGFGEVHKGRLPNGQEIAVKRLSKDSMQGVQEFVNKVKVLAKVQHRNLVKLLGYCVQGEETILIYEYVPKKSLDYFLFDPEKQQGQLDWTTRFKIVKGIAWGIQYLHDDSRLRVVHHDVKVSNILLDSDMNPKISGFGRTKIFMFDQTQGNCDTTGTFGYIAPEHFLTGEFSVKSDVYSFGVLLLEIISGKRVISGKNNDSFHQMMGFVHLLSYARKLWKDGKALELLDPTIRESYNPNEVLRCVHIGMLCVQKDPANRPSMSSIVLMLECYSMTLPSPSLT